MVSFFSFYNTIIGLCMFCDIYRTSPNNRVRVTYPGFLSRRKGEMGAVLTMEVPSRKMLREVSGWTRSEE